MLRRCWFAFALFAATCAQAQVSLGTSGLATAAISGDGNTAIVGLPGDNKGVGAALIFVRSGGTWIQQGGKLVGADAAGNAAQGISVALSFDGNTAVVGGWNDNNRIGATWIWVRSGGTWTQQGGKLVGGPVNSPVANEGSAVAISADGNTVLVGAYNDLNALLTTGSAYVFVRSNGTWTQQGTKLIGNDFFHGQNVSINEGSSVALSSDGNTAAIGAQTDNGGVGAAWVFIRNNNLWAQQSIKLVGAGASGLANQGSSIAISADGNTLVVGGPNDGNNTGAAWIFTRLLGGWIQQGGKLVGSGAVGAAQQGSSVAISGDGSIVVLGGPGDNNNSGALWVFKRSNGAWIQQGTKIATAAGAQLGSSVGLSSDGGTLIASGTQGPYIITQPTSLHAAITAPASAATGLAFQFTASAVDANNNVATSYNGTMHFSSSDAAAILPPDSPLTNGTLSFSATLYTVGAQTITATDTANAAITGTSGPISVGLGTAPGSVTPPSASGLAQKLTFTFNDPRGYQDLDVVNILINNFLDGRQACYLAYSQPSKVLYLVSDAGGGLLGGLTNSQCSISNFTALPSGNTLTLAMTVTFTASFAGNKVIYLAARDVQGGNSGWQALGVSAVPGTATDPSVVGVSPPRGTGCCVSFTFSFGDTNGFQDLGVVNILINDFLDGRNACYIAYSRPANAIYVVNDASTALAPTPANSQCTVSLAGVSTAGNQLTLNLNITFTSAFRGNHVIYMAARDVTDTKNSGWQASGTWTVQ